MARTLRSGPSLFALLAVGAELGSAACAGCATLEGAAFVFAHTAPNAGVLARFKSPLQACVHDGTATADALCFLDLEKRRAGIAYWEEKLRVLVKAGRAVTPIHADQSLHS
jgi:hypothetical protein